MFTQRDMSGKFVLVTGATRGIGRRFPEHVVSTGANLPFCCKVLFPT